MAHNPVLSEEKLSLVSTVAIQKGTIGLIYKNGRLIRTLDPGTQPGLTERVSSTLYIVDKRPHQLTHRVKLPSASPKFDFPIRIDLDYQVEDATQMIDNHVDDTEQIVIRALDPIFRKQSQSLAPERYAAIGQMLEDTLSQNLFKSLGLALNKSYVIVEPSSTLAEWALANQADQQANHEDVLPSKEPSYSFKVRAIVTYRVIDSQKRSNGTPAETESMLWRRICMEFSPISRRYTIDEIDSAEEKLRNLIHEKPEHEGYGVRITDIQLALELDGRAREHRDQIVEFQHNQALETLKADGAKLERAREEERIEFYKRFMKEDDLRAILLKNNPNDVQAILRSLDEREQARFQRLVDMVRLVHEQKNTLMDSDIEKIILDLFGRGGIAPESVIKALPASSHQGDQQASSAADAKNNESVVEAEFRIVEEEFTNDSKSDSK